MAIPFPSRFRTWRFDVPILSVKKYLANGYDFHFTEDGGYMRCRANGKKFQFIESENAYWIKLKVHDPNDAVPGNQGFHRPGNP